MEGTQTKLIKEKLVEVIISRSNLFRKKSSLVQIGKKVHKLKPSKLKPLLVIINTVITLSKNMTMRNFVMGASYKTLTVHPYHICYEEPKNQRRIRKCVNS
jgi:hypothetical protein